MRCLATMALLGAASAVAAQNADSFLYSPTPRWKAEPDMDEVCVAVRRECPQLANLPEIAATLVVDELYDASGRLSGLRLERGTGCAPIDESFLLGHREFRDTFHREGESDLDGIRAELQPGVDPAKVRIVRSYETNYSSGFPQ